MIFNRSRLSISDIVFFNYQIRCGPFCIFNNICTTLLILSNPRTPVAWCKVSFKTYKKRSQPQEPVSNFKVDIVS